MDYFATNSNDQVTWSQRTMPFSPSQNKSFGGSYEYAIMLCNAKGKDMWLNIPLKVDSTFIVNLAKLTRYGSDGVNPYSGVQVHPVFPPLNPGLHLYVEYSNEIWNTASAFKQGNDNYNLAMAEVTAGNSPLNFDGVTNNGWGWAGRRVGKKIVEISNTFRSVWGDAAMMTTVRPVLQGQQGTCSTSALLFIDQIYSTASAWCSTPHPINYYLYGTGGSGYYGPNNNDLTLTLDNFWNSSSMKSSTFTSNMRKESAVAHAFGLKRVCYEGGPSMDPANNPASAHVDSVKAQAYNDPRMKASMVNLFDNAWSATDGDLLVYYCSTGFINEYAWSFTNDIFNLNTPKLQGIDQLNTVNKVAPTICSVPPCILLGNNCESNFALGTYSYFNGSALHVKQNSYSIFMFRITTAGTYNVSAKLNTNSGPLRIVVDGVLIGTETVSGTLPSYTMSNLQPGLHTVMFKTSTGETEFATVTINPGAGQKGVITSISNSVDKNEIKFYPNPATDFVNINLANKNESATVIICEITGKIILKSQVTSHQGVCQINTQNLTNGVYIVNVLNGSSSWSGKLCICK